MLCGRAQLTVKIVKNRDGIHMKRTKPANTIVGKRIDGKKKGEGTLTLANGDKYVGEWDNDLKNGQGTYTYADGDTYVGEWVDDKKNGQGTYTYANGGRYVGEWDNDLKNGQGISTYGNSDSCYVGEFKDGKRHGQGTYTLASGASYVGDWKDGEMNGQGTLNLLNGDKYTGEFKNSKFNGQGTITEANGDSYVIECKNSEQLGQGTSAKDDLHIDDFDWSDINKHGEEQPEHLYEDYEIDQIQEWMRGCLNGVTQSVDELSELVGQVSLPDFVEDLDWITLFTDMFGNDEFDSWLAKGPHRNRRCKLSPIHLMGAVLEGEVVRHDYYATWLPEIGITVISVYSGEPDDFYRHVLALGYIEGAFSVAQTNDILPTLCWIWRWHTKDISQWEFRYDDEDSPCGTECLFNNDLVSEYLLNETKA